MTELPGGWIIACAFLGLLYAFMLYRKDSALDSVPVNMRRLLFALRTLLVFLISLLLLSPLIRTISRDKEKPVIVFAQDNSQSIVMNKDSAFYRKQYAENVRKVLGSLTEKYDVQTVSFGDKVTDQLDFQFNNRQTDFSSLFDQLENRFQNRNIGAIVIASDGLYNQGSSPLYSSGELKVPYYTVALGDTTVQKDIFISKVNFNKTVYLGNNFPVEITVNARQCAGAVSTLKVMKDSSVIFTKDITPAGMNFSQIVPLVLEAKTKGLNHYRMVLSSISGEMTTVNNERDIYVEVIENRQKILLLADAPHPDIAAIKSAIETSENYEVNVQTADKFSGSTRDYNLVILHNLPSGDHPVADLLSRMKTEQTSVLYIAGTQIRPSAFNELQTGVEIAQPLEKSNIVSARLNSDFSLFTLSDAFRSNVAQFPPLQQIYGRYRSTGNNGILFYQQIGSVATDQPLQTFNQSSDQRIGVICGEGLWRWRMTDYQLNGNFDVFREWILKTVQNLSVKEEKTHFRIVTKNNFAENEQVTFEAEVYNDNFELVNQPDVHLVITAGVGKTYPFTFSKTEKAYQLNSGFFPAGDYAYKANVKLGDKVYSSSGKFTVSRLQAELSETVADHSVLSALSTATGGEMVYPSQLASLEQLLEKRNDIKTVSYAHYKLKDWIDIKALFFLLLILLSLEWFLRKRAGTY